MGLFSLVGNFLGARSAAKASRNATAAQERMSQAAIDEQRRQFDQTRGDYAPWLRTGSASLERLFAMIGGAGPEAQAEAMAGLEQSPEFQATVRNGEEALLANASATGGLRGGNTQRSLADFRSDAFARQYGTQIQRLFGLAGMGQGAVDNVSSIGAANAAGIANQYNMQGANQAQGMLTRGGINAQMFNNLGSYADRTVGRLFGIPGIGGG